jgi:KaiC/GvpD/RAD55 family RecA-like ATPase
VRRQRPCFFSRQIRSYWSPGCPYLSTIADAILAVDYATTGYHMDRRMRVIKMRGSDREQHPYWLAIQPGGLRVTRLTEDEAREIEHRRARR